MRKHDWATRRSRSWSTGPFRPQGRPRLAHIIFPDSVNVWVKWTPAPRGGAADNAEPRYEIGAYRLQKLFLDEPDYVVPPTVGRIVPRSAYPEVEPGPNLARGVRSADTVTSSRWA
jgi:hypothetical protein